MIVYRKDGESLMPQTDKDLLQLLDERRKRTGKSWSKLTKEAGVYNATVYRWYRLGCNVYLDRWLTLLEATGGWAFLRTKDGRLHRILSANGTLNTHILSQEAQRKGTALYLIGQKLGLGRGLVYNWATGTFPTLRSLCRVLEQLDMILVVRETRA